jgi:hypothetical protein
MKKILPLLLVVVTTASYSQNIGIGTKKPLSKLHVAGSLRVDSLAAMKSKGIVLHNTSGEVYSLKLTGSKTDVLSGDGTFVRMDAVLATGPTWLTTGNAGVEELTNFLGTTDARALFFRVNNIKAGILHPVSGNVAFGKRALNVNRLGSNEGHSNIAIGTDALRNNLSGRNLIAIGDSAMFTQVGNTADALGVPLGNLAIGSKALYLNRVGSGNLAVGENALNRNTSNDNTAIGHNSLRSNTAGGGNVAVGTIALNRNTTGSGNTGVGYHSIHAGGGNWNTAVGLQSMGNTSGTGNTALGAWAMYGAPFEVGGAKGVGNNNTAVGYSSLQFPTEASGTVAVGNNNVAVGAESLSKTIGGSNNTAVGFRALFNNVNGRTLVAVGDSALYNQVNNASGLYGNTAIGSGSMFRNTTGYRNTAIGYQSLLTNTTGGGNTAVGNGADVTAATLINATALGFNTKVNASNKVRIGNAAVTRIEGQVPFTIPSDGRYKFNVREDVKGLEFIMRLRPVTYQFDVKKFDGGMLNAGFAGYDKAQMMRRTGFIAQEVENAAGESQYDFSGVTKPDNAKDHYSLSYESFVVPLVKAVQEQQHVISNLNSKLKEQEEKIDMLIKEIERIKQSRQ